MFSGKNQILKFLIIWLSAFGGLLGGAAIGNFFSIVLYKLPGELWSVLMFIAPLERAVFALGSMLIGVPLIAGLAKIGIFTGPTGDENPANLPEYQTCLQREPEPAKCNEAGNP